MDFLTWQKKGGKGGMSPKRIKAVTKKDRRQQCFIVVPKPIALP